MVRLSPPWPPPIPQHHKAIPYCPLRAPRLRAASKTGAVATAAAVAFALLPTACADPAVGRTASESTTPPDANVGDDSANGLPAVAAGSPAPLDTVQADGEGGALDATSTQLDAGDASTLPAPSANQGEALGAPYKVVDGCAVLEPYDPKKASVECEGKVCEAGHICMAAGLCLPLGKWHLAEEAPNVLQPAIAIRSDHEWAVAYAARLQETDKAVLDQRIRFRRFIGAETGGNPAVDVSGKGHYSNPTLLALGPGRWLAGWLWMDKAFLLARHQVRVLREDGSIGTVTSLHTDTTFIGAANQHGVRLAQLGGHGSRVAVFGFGGNGSHPGKARVVARLIGEDGSVASGIIPISLPGDHAWAPEVASLQVGGVVLWSGADEAGGLKLNPLRVRGRRLDQDGQPTGPSFQLPDLGMGLMYEGSIGVTALANDSLLVSKSTCASKLGPCDHERYVLLVETLLATAPMGGHHYLGPNPSDRPIFPARQAPINGQRAVIAWAPFALGSPTATTWLKRYYRPENVYDCQPEPIPVPAAAAPSGAASSHFAIAAFPDGRILAAWRENQLAPKDTSRLTLRFIPR